jgi:pyruvate/2-oxoglutarate dehydrogenase complex dihydrolipoamide dehydrogenase (E3) component
MAGYDYDIGILGGGAAGLTVASGAAQLGAKALLIEKEADLGGDCLHFGCVPSKTLIRSAHVYHLMKSSEQFGLPKIQAPPVDFQQIARRIRNVISTIQHHDSEERFCQLGAKVMFGEALFTDDHTVDLDGKRYTAKNWVIATGSSPIAPPIPGLHETRFLTNREIFSLDRLPSSMTILGAGPIGIEMAQAFNRLGTQVVVVDRADQILMKEDKDMADTVQSVMMEEGVNFYLKASIEEVRDNNVSKEVFVIDEFGEKLPLKSEEILVAMGRSPNTSDLGLETIRVAVERGGITVDNRLRTSRKHIYAAGDVNGGFQFTHAAGYEGGIVVSNAIFHLPRKTDYTYLPWCTYTDPELASIGMNEKTAESKGIEYKVWTEEFKDNDRSLAEADRVGKVKMILDAGEKPIGVQILGPRAGELLSEWVAILNGKTKLSTVAAAIHPYPTLGEINKRVVGNYFSPKIFSDTIQKGLKFFFNLKGRACRMEDLD